MNIHRASSELVGAHCPTTFATWLRSTARPDAARLGTDLNGSLTDGTVLHVAWHTFAGSLHLRGPSGLAAGHSFCCAFILISPRAMVRLGVVV